MLCSSKTNMGRLSFFVQTLYKTYRHSLPLVKFWGESLLLLFCIVQMYYFSIKLYHSTTGLLGEELKDLFLSFGVFSAYRKTNQEQK